MGSEIREVEIALRLHHHDARLMISHILISLECQNESQCLATQRRQYLDARLSCHPIDGGNQLLHLLYVVHYRLAVQGKQQIFAFFQMLLIHHGRALHALLQESDVVNEHIAHHIYLREFGSLLVGDAVVRDTRREEDIRQTINHQSVDFLRHGDIEAAGTCRNMRQLHALLLGNDSHGHRRSQVIYHDDHIRRMLLQIALKLSHHLSGKLVHVLAVHTQIYIRLPDVQVRKQGILQRLVVLTTREHQLILHIFALLLGVLYRSNHRSHLNEVRSRSGHNTNFLIHILSLLTVKQKFTYY